MAEPYMTLARFDGAGAVARYRDITYRWMEGGAHDQPDTWAEASWNRFHVRQRWMPLSRLSGAADVDELVIAPLIGLGDQSS